MKVSIHQVVSDLPTRSGHVIVGLGVYWDFGRREIDGKKKLHGSLCLDFLIWTIDFEFRPW